MSDLLNLADRVEASKPRYDNALDVLVEVAMFEPCADYVAARSNDAGTKVIYTMRDRTEITCWAKDWTMWPDSTAASLRAIHARGCADGEDDRG